MLCCFFIPFYLDIFTPYVIFWCVPGYWANLLCECSTFSGGCLLNLQQVIVQFWQNICYTPIHWGRQTEILSQWAGSDLPVICDESPERWERVLVIVWRRQWGSEAVRQICKCCHYVVSPGRGVSTELTLSLGYNLARSFIHLCAAITSRDRYGLTPHHTGLRHSTWAPLSSAGRHCHLWWGGRWEVWRGRWEVPSLVLCNLISGSALASVHILSHCHDRQAAESLSQSLARAQLQSVGEISETERSDWLTECLLTTTTPLQSSVSSPSQWSQWSPVLSSPPRTSLSVSVSVRPWPEICGGSGGTRRDSRDFNIPQPLSLSLSTAGSSGLAGSRKINSKFRTSLRYLSAIFVIEGSQ